MKTKQSFKLTALAVTLATLTANIQPLSATPDWPMQFDGTRTLDAPVLPDGYQKATPEQKTAILQAVKHLISNETVFLWWVDFLSPCGTYGGQSDLNDLKKYPFAKQLPEPFAGAFFNLIDAIEEVKQQQPSHYQFSESNQLSKNWALIDAICRQEFGFSLEQQCDLLASRGDSINQGYLKSLIPQTDRRHKLQNDWKNHYRENAALHDHRAAALIDIILAPNNYQGTASPQLRKTIMDWYHADFLNRINQKEPEKAASIAPPPTLPPDLLQLIKSAENKHVKPRDQITVDQSKLSLRLIQLVGVTKTEYTNMLTTLLKKTITTKTGIKTDDYDQYDKKAKDPTQDPLYQQTKAQLLNEWQNNGFPSMPLPYSGPESFPTI